MTKKEKFNVAEATFAAMLSKNGLYIDYFTLWARTKGLNYGDTLLVQWRTWAKCRDFDHWLIASFLFDKWHIPARVWHDLNYQWNTWLEQNFNK